MSVRTKAAFFDGMSDNWFHFSCFWKRTRPNIAEGNIRGIDWLKWDDQERIRRCIATAGEQPKSAESDSAQKFAIEVAKSARGKCKTCTQIIPKVRARTQTSALVFETKQFYQNKNDIKKLENIKNLYIKNQKSSRIISKMNIKNCPYFSVPVILFELFCRFKDLSHVIILFLHSLLMKQLK
jgi:hypothetical protein